MHAPTHAIPTHPQLSARVSVLRQKALLNRQLMWCRHLFRGFQSLHMRYRSERPQLGNERWIPQREMLQKPPTGSAMELFAARREAPRSILLYTLLP